jgi:hypothetical protein
MSTDQTTTPVKKKRAKKGSKSWYFTAETDLSIRKYNESEDFAVRSKIYSSEIKPAFEKLVENIIHTFKFYYTDGQSLGDLQHEVVSFLIEKLPKFSSDKGKAFSYFSIVAKNYLILSNNKNYKKLTDSSRIDNINEEMFADTLADNIDDQVLPDFIDYFVGYYDVNLENCFTKKTDLLVASAIVELFRKRENLEIFNKKALYIYIREMTNASTQQITKVVKLIKDKYKAMFTDYDRLGFIPHNKIY